MKKYIKSYFLFLISYLLISSSAAHAFQTFRDETLFNSLYENPLVTIEFTQLIDGSTFNGSSTSSSPFVVYSSLPNNYQVRDTAWSGYFTIGSSQLNCNCAWLATMWSGNEITKVVYNRFYVLSNGNSLPFSIVTDNGFYGFTPANNSETYFLMGNEINTIKSISYGFSTASSPVPEPNLYVMFIAGLILIKTQNNRGQPA